MYVVFNAVVPLLVVPVTIVLTIVITLLVSLGIARVMGCITIVFVYDAA